MPAVKAHFRALPYSEIPEALDIVESSTASRVANLALRFLIFTAARTGEVRGAMWSEIHGDVWKIPGERMKAGVEHRVPLSATALDGLEQARTLRDGSALVFPSPIRRGRPLSNMTLTKVLRDLGARVVGGGQTNNPSVEDIADAVRSVGAQQVIVLPNNKNIILAAERVADLLPEKAVHVLPTKTVGAGLAAAVLFQEGVPVDQQIGDMAEAADHTITFEITAASRDARFDGVDVQEGEIIGLVDGVLRKSGTTPESCLIDLLQETDLGEFEVGTLFFSAAVGEEAAHVMLDSITDICPDLDVQVLGGGPDLYPYLFALE